MTISVIECLICKIVLGTWQTEAKGVTKTEIYVSN